MGKLENIMAAVLRGASDSNIGFTDLRNLLESLGFEVRIKGDHFIYTKAGSSTSSLWAARPNPTRSNRFAA